MSRNKKASPGDLTRTCYVCQETKTTDAFVKLRTGVDGVGTLCKACKRVKSSEWRSDNPNHNQEWRAKNKLSRKEYERARSLRRYHGITVEQYNKMFEEQNGKCAICKLPATTGQGKRLHVDHNHVTGEIRGLLCHGCNTSIGHFKENVASLKAAIGYLEMHNGL